MLWVVCVVELVLWFYGVVMRQTLGGFLHILLILAAIAAITELGLSYRKSRSQKRPLGDQDEELQFPKAG